MDGIPNPHWAGAPARMSDGRQFTDYRSEWKRMPVVAAGAGPWAFYDQRQAVLDAGATQRASDRSLTALRVGQSGCVDTMVPEVAKRVYSWNGPVVAAGIFAGGIGTGRMYLPGRPELVGGDPDRLAATTVGELPGTFDANPGLYVAAPSALPAALGGIRPSNRYSAPYG